MVAKVVALLSSETLPVVLLVSVGANCILTLLD